MMIMNKKSNKNDRFAFQDNHEYSHSFNDHQNQKHLTSFSEINERNYNHNHSANDFLNTSGASRVAGGGGSYSLQYPTDIDQVIQTVTLYIKSASELSNNLSRGLSPENQSFSNNSPSPSIIEKVNLFILKCELYAQEILRNIDLFSNEKLSQYVKTQQKMLQHLSDKYNSLIKEAYRVLNAQVIHNQGSLPQQVIEKVKNNRRLKIQQIQMIESQMEKSWKQMGNKKQKTFEVETSQSMIGLNKTAADHNTLQGFNISLKTDRGKSQKNFQVLGQLSKEQLAKMTEQQLRKQFLSIRIAASNMYERFMSHNHIKLQQELEMAKQQQQILANQLEKELQISSDLADQLSDMERQMSEFLTVNELIKRRNIQRESIRIETEADDI